MAVKRQIVLGAASLAALYVGVSSALGLGEMQLNSALNQPLSAIIVLQGAEGLSPDDVLVSLADAATFDDAGITRPFFLTDLRFKPVLRGNK
ncbi:MAG: peptidoglycan-binding protein LysM, partial [Pseudomonas neustonica]